MNIRLYTIFFFILFDLGCGAYAQKTVPLHRVEGYSEEMFREDCDTRTLEWIEGIWRNEKGDVYAIERFENPDCPGVLSYRIVLLTPCQSVNKKSRGYKKPFIPGFILAYIEPGRTSGTYRVAYFRPNIFGVIKEYIFKGTENAGRFIIETPDGKIQLLKVYPSLATLSQESRRGKQTSGQIAAPSGKRVTSSDPEEPEKQPFSVAFEDALANCEANDYGAALDILDGLIRNHPDDLEALYLKAEICHYKLKRTDDAIAALTQAEEYCRTDFRIYFVRANAYLLKNDLLPAIQDLSKVLALKEDYTDAYYIRAAVKTELGDIEGALADLTCALNHYERVPSKMISRIMIYNEMACCLMDNCEYESARSMVDEAIWLSPGSDFCLDTKGQICFKQEQYDSCIYYMNRSIGIRPSGSSYYWRGEAKYCLGLEAEALADLSRAGEFGVAGAFVRIRQIREKRK